MHTYVVTENIRRFREMLETEQCADRRRVLATMLQEEEAKLAELQREAKTPLAPPARRP